MQAFHNEQAIKDKYVQRMQDHIIADELIRGEGFNSEGKGCAVGCTLNNYDHAQYPVELGIPEWLAHVEDTLFEGMSLEKSKTFPLEFLQAIKPGVDLEKVKVPFLLIVLRSVLDKFDHEENPGVLKAIKTVIDLYESGETDRGKFARTAVEAEAAGSTAWESARGAARAATAAGWASFYANACAKAVGWASGSEYDCDRFADELLKLLRQCN